MRRTQAKLKSKSEFSARAQVARDKISGDTEPWSNSWDKSSAVQPRWTFSGQFLMPPLWSIPPSGCDLTIPLTGSTVRRKYQSNQQWRNTFYTQGTLRFSSSTRFSGVGTGVGGDSNTFPCSLFEGLLLSSFHSAETLTGENGWKKQKPTFKVKGYEQPAGTRPQTLPPGCPLGRRSAMIPTVNIGDWA